MNNEQRLISMFQFTRLVCLFAASVAGSSLAKKLARRTGHRAPA